MVLYANALLTHERAMMLSLLQLSAAGSPPRALSPLVAGTKRRRLLAEMGDELETAHSMLDPADVASFPVGPSGATELGLRWPWQLPPSFLKERHVCCCKWLAFQCQMHQCLYQSTPGCVAVASCPMRPSYG